MRTVGDLSQFTPFGIWIRHYCRNSGLNVTNLDYIFEDYVNRKIMLLEEKQCGGVLHTGQRLTFKVLDNAIRLAISHTTIQCPYDYWGFYILQFPHNKVMPCTGMTLNGLQISSEQLVAHLNFQKKFCEPLVL